MSEPFVVGASREEWKSLNRSKLVKEPMSALAAALDSLCGLAPSMPQDQWSIPSSDGTGVAVSSTNPTGERAKVLAMIEQTHAELLRVSKIATSFPTLSPEKRD